MRRYLTLSERSGTNFYTIALCTGAILGFFGAAMFVLGTRTDKRRKAPVDDPRDLPAVEPLHLADFNDDSYLGTVASRLRHSRSE